MTVCSITILDDSHLSNNKEELVIYCSGSRPFLLSLWSQFWNSIIFYWWEKKKTVNLWIICESFNNILIFSNLKKMGEVKIEHTNVMCPSSHSLPGSNPLKILIFNRRFRGHHWNSWGHEDLCISYSCKAWRYSFLCWERVSRLGGSGRARSPGPSQGVRVVESCE